MPETPDTAAGFAEGPRDPLLAHNQPGPSLGDLAERLQRADDRLSEKANDPSVGLMERTRLNGKVEGVRLALSYLREYR